MWSSPFPPAFIASTSPRFSSGDSVFSLIISNGIIGTESHGFLVYSTLDGVWLLADDRMPCCISLTVLQSALRGDFLCSSLEVKGITLRITFSPFLLLRKHLHSPHTCSLVLISLSWTFPLLRTYSGNSKARRHVTFCPSLSVKLPNELYLPFSWFLTLLIYSSPKEMWL